MKTKPRFNSKDQSLFFPTLKKRVDAYFKENNLSKQGDVRMLIKSITMLALYLIPYILILTLGAPIWLLFLLAFVMAIGKAGIGMAVMHDANHGAYSSKNWKNRLFGSTLYLVGGSSAIWKVQHNVLHHTYTNVYHIDEDVETKFILRLSPYAELKGIHKYQHFYAFLLYGLMTISFLVKDLFKVFRYHSENLSQKKGNLFINVVKIFTSKFIYIVFALLIPYWVLNLPFLTVFLGFLFVHFVAGLILSVVFQLAHVVEGTEHHVAEENGTMENTWAIHQLKSTADFARKSHLLNWYLGGLNFQIEHHLFPNICHIHYKDISEIVKSTALEFDLPYNDQPTFGSAIISHIHTLKEFGTQDYNEKLIGA